MTNFDPHRYTITIKRVTDGEDEHFEASVAELPDLFDFAESHEQVYALVLESITVLREAALEQGRLFPDPLPSQATEEFSGRVTLRMSKSLHASVSKLASREEVSLNSWIVEAIAERTGREQSLHQAENIRWRGYSAHTSPEFVVIEGGKSKTTFLPNATGIHQSQDGPRRREVKSTNGSNVVLVN